MGLRTWVVATMVCALTPVTISLAPPAAADCTGAGAATVCAQGEVRGGGPTAPVAGPVYPSYCADPWYCDDNWGVEVILPIRPGRPGGPGGGGGIGGSGIGGGGGGISPR